MEKYEKWINEGYREVTIKRLLKKVGMIFFLRILMNKIKNLWYRWNNVGLSI